MRKIRKRKTNRNLIYGIVFSAMLFLTIGYSVLTTSLNFNITAHKNMGFKVGDQVEVLGLSPTFHVVEVGEKYLKLLSDKAEGFSKFSGTPVTRFEDSEVYSTLNYLTRNWKSNITSAGGTTTYYNVTLISREELQNLIWLKDPDANLNRGVNVNLANIGLGWITDYQYSYNHNNSGIVGFFTSTLELTNGAYWLVNFIVPKGYTSGYFWSVDSGYHYIYGMDIRPYLTIDIESVKKL